MEMQTETDRADGTRRRPGRARRMAWKAANGLSLGGLWPWPLQPGWLQRPQLALPLRGLGEGFRGARLVHISDLHCGPFVRDHFLCRCADEINALEPDFVVVTGDLVTVPRRRYTQRVAKVLSHLTPQIATLAVLGNHDYGIWHPVMPSRWDAATDLTARLEDAGVIVLNNESRDFFRSRAAVQFVGVEDLWCSRHDLARAFKYTRPGVPTVGLVHNPDAAPDMARRGAQWVLAGHTHAMPNRHNRFHGTIFPTRHRHFVAGRYALGDSNNLYVNAGLGPARRFRSWQRPEITVFALQPARTGEPKPARRRGRSGAGARPRGQ